MNFIIKILLFSSLIFHVISGDVINFSPSSLTLPVRSEHEVEIKLDKIYEQSVTVNFTYGDENEVKNYTNGIIDSLDSILFEAYFNASKSIKIKSNSLVGHLVVGVTSDDINIPEDNLLRIDVVHSSTLNILMSIIGWIYFAAWSISFYPQLILNFKRKSVVGLNFDFLSLNLLGHSCYMVFNVSLYFIDTVQYQYFKIHPRGVNPVQLNDVLFSMHASLLTLLTVFQCFFYERGDQRVSKIAIGILTILVGFLTVSFFVMLTGKLDGLNYAYYFSYVKLAITLMKYFPQAYMNYKRKSTVGWSIINILLDFTGGSLSLLQMFLLAYNFNDWSSIFGSPTKFGLGFFSILFDIVFIIQHYGLYRNSTSSSSSYEPIPSSDDDNNNNDSAIIQATP